MLFRSLQGGRFLLDSEALILSGSAATCERASRIPGCFNPRGVVRVFPVGSGFGMAKSKKKAEVVFLVCEETGDLNYTLRRKPGGEKLKIKKYSPRLRKHTLHAEKKK